MGVRLKWEDKDGLQLAIKKASAPPNSRILAAIALRMRGMQIQHFLNEEDSSGKRWAPLKSSTIRRRRAGGKGVRILQDTGRLRASIVRFSDRSNAIVGTNVIYAPTHQFGRGSIPAREFLYLTDSERVELVEFVTNEILKPFSGKN